MTGDVGQRTGKDVAAFLVDPEGPTALAGITSAGSGRFSPRTTRRSGPPLGPGLGTAASRCPEGQGPGGWPPTTSWVSTPVSPRRACSSRSSIMTLTSAWSRVTCPTARSIAQPPVIHQGTARPDSREPTACTGPKPALRMVSIKNCLQAIRQNRSPGGWRSGLGDAAGERWSHEFIRHRTPPPHAATCHQHSCYAASGGLCVAGMHSWSRPMIVPLSRRIGPMRPYVQAREE